MNSYAKPFFFFVGPYNLVFGVLQTFEGHNQNQINVATVHVRGTSTNYGPTERWGPEWMRNAIPHPSTRMPERRIRTHNPGERLPDRDRCSIPSDQNLDPQGEIVPVGCMKRHMHFLRNHCSLLILQYSISLSLSLSRSNLGFVVLRCSLESVFLFFCCLQPQSRQALHVIFFLFFFWVFLSVGRGVEVKNLVSLELRCGRGAEEEEEEEKAEL